MEINRTPFKDSDIIRRTKFTELYNWGVSVGMNNKRAFYIAQNKTLKEYPYTPQEIRQNTFTKPNEKEKTKEA